MSSSSSSSLSSSSSSTTTTTTTINTSTINTTSFSSLFYTLPRSQIKKAVDSIFLYLKKCEQENMILPNGRTLLFDTENDINLLVELKIQLPKASIFKSIPIPLKHSFRDRIGHHTVCIITRTKDASLWNDVLIHEYPIKNVTKVMGYTEFSNHYVLPDKLNELCDIFDLFIIHPAIVTLLVPQLIRYVRRRNKHLAILPSSKLILNVKNPLKVPRKLSKEFQMELEKELKTLEENFIKELKSEENYKEMQERTKTLKQDLKKKQNEIRKSYQEKNQQEYNQTFMQKQAIIRQRLARKIALYRDCTFFPNYHFTHKFIKVAEWGDIAGDSEEDKQFESQKKLQVIENIEQILRYLPALLPSGGLDNILRLSLHIGNTTIQLPVYHNVMPNPLFVLIGEDYDAVAAAFQEGKGKGKGKGKKNTNTNKNEKENANANANVNADENEKEEEKQEPKQQLKNEKNLDKNIEDINLNTGLGGYINAMKHKRKLPLQYREKIKTTVPFSMNLVDLCTKKRVSQCEDISAALGNNNNNNNGNNNNIL